MTDQLERLLRQTLQAEARSLTFHVASVQVMAHYRRRRRTQLARRATLLLTSAALTIMGVGALAYYGAGHHGPVASPSTTNALTASPSAAASPPPKPTPGPRPTPSSTVRPGLATLAPFVWHRGSLRAAPQVQIVWGDAGYVLWAWSNELDYADQSALYVSSDGQAWSAVPRFWNPRTTTLHQLLAQPGAGYLAVLSAYDDPSSAWSIQMWSSLDGHHWQQADDPSFRGRLPVGLIANDGRLVLVGRSDGAGEGGVAGSAVWTSQDGLSWTQRATFRDLSATSLERLGTGLAITGTRSGDAGRSLPFAYSPDGVSWSTAATDEPLPALASVQYGTVGYGAGMPTFTDGAWRLSVYSFAWITISCPIAEACRRLEPPVTTYTLSSNDLLRWHVEAHETATLPPEPTPGPGSSSAPASEPSGPTTTVGGVQLRAIQLYGPGSFSDGTRTPAGAILQQSLDGTGWTDLQFVDAMRGSPVALAAGPDSILLVMDVTNYAPTGPIEIHSEVWVAKR